MLQIEIQQVFDQPLDEVFSVLSDHVHLGHIVGADIQRIVDSNSADINGLGSVRRISSFIIPAFEETIVNFKPNELIEYTVSKGSPIKNHLGSLRFSQQNNQTLLDYTIAFEPKINLPGWGRLLAVLIRAPIAKGLKKYAN